MSENEIKNYVVIQNSKKCKKSYNNRTLIYILKVLLFQLELYKIFIFLNVNRF